MMSGQQQATSALIPEAADALAKASQYAAKAEAELTVIRDPDDDEEAWAQVCANAGHLAQLSQAYSALAYVEIVNREIEQQESRL